MAAPKKILVAVAWPYATGPLHLGHIAGAYLPPDIFARYHRMAGNDVLMVSGSDTHGTPITVAAHREGISPQEVVDRFHPMFLEYWARLGIQFDLFTTTDTETHHVVAQQFFLRLLERGLLYRKVVEQLYDTEAESFLPDRYVEGTCPHCGNPNARGDQCDDCGRTLDPEQLISPRSSLTGTTPSLRQTEHYYWKLSEMQQPLLQWLRAREGWRPHVLNFAVGMVEDGLHDRAFTRDIEWGISLPVDDLGPGKTIYVWWEAVMGYLSAPQEWAERVGDPEAWKAWWMDPGAESYYFVGKDNIPFHAVYWPALLMGHGDLNLPTNVAGNQFVTFGGSKASKSMGVGRALDWYLDRFEPDALRYGIAANLPETSDTELYDEELVRSVNDELVATWGNLVNRVVAMTGRYASGAVPARGPLERADEALLAAVDDTVARVGDSIGAVKLRAGLREAMAGAAAANAYLNEMQPWKTAAHDPARTGTTLFVALQAIAGIAVALSPYLPFTSPRVLEALGVGDGNGWRVPKLAAGTQLGDLGHLFAKIDPPADE